MRHITIVLLLICLLSSCSFKPLYSTTNRQTTQTVQSVKFTTPKTVYGYILQNHLQSLSNPNKHSSHYKYDLNVEITLREVEIAKASTGVASHKQLIVSAPYKLTRLCDNKVIKSGTVTSTSTYDTSGTPFANTVNEEKLRDKMMEELAHDLNWQIIEIFENENPSCQNK